MKNLLKSAVIMAAIAGPVAAEAPIWETSQSWTCPLERHMRLPLGGDVVDMPPEGKGYDIDFAAGEVTSAFTNGTGRITQRYHHASTFGDHNILVIDWGSGEYPMTIIAEDGTYFELAASGRGSDNGEVWMALYTCTPN